MEDIRHLRSFVCVAEHLNFTKAAEQLYIGQSTLSKHIAELEEQLGVQLFIRTHHSVHLTPPGAILFDESRPIMAKIDAIFEKTRKSQIKVWGTLKIGCMGIEHVFLPKIIKHFAALYPHVTLDIRVMPVTLMNEALECQELDLGFNPFIGNKLTSKFKVREVRRARMCFLFPRHHPYANKYSVDLADLKQESFILIDPATLPLGADWFTEQCHLRGFAPHIVSLVTRVEALFWQVSAGLGISFWCFDPVFSQMLRHSISLVAMKGANAYGNIGVVWKNDNPNPIIPLFLKEFDGIASGAKIPLKRLVAHTLSEQ
ncbi:LysR family transcriptional regulator [Sporomusa acidovorans]|uniref:HTH-type transcriptional regulator HdfR n=1 Tax=Sporomusa acidovorans (strain ATCC 49682 / DSM 3132 / Mol) TaxID=1123286 RepID=A0ABZ3J5B6_SPOA4|nr:LysR family transcriptional regulator [Sporomusa acidovorans]OZC16358.1 HTH-type transcriptional regulator GltC [Sporomusa acidovorans DSM 3132]SDF00962.1 DNA-binding transcriptional regulator, LysR family [Sporomusa acidovorans]